MRRVIGNQATAATATRSRSCRDKPTVRAGLLERPRRGRAAAASRNTGLPQATVLGPS